MAVIPLELISWAVLRDGTTLVPRSRGWVAKAPNGRQATAATWAEAHELVHAQICVTSRCVRHGGPEPCVCEPPATEPW